MKIKYLLVVMAMIIASVGFSQERTLKAFFTGYDEYFEMYSFEDKDGDYIEFYKIDSEVLKKFNLNALKFINEEFTITYITEEIGEEENKITKLERTGLKRNDEQEYEDEDE